MVVEEKIITSIPGVMALGWRSRSISFQGYGSHNAPENSLIVTNKRIIFATAPVFGAGKIIYGINFTAFYYWFGRRFVKKKLEEPIQYNTLDQILSSNKKNFEILLQNITNIETKRKKITFFMNDNQKFKYLIRSKKDMEILQHVFSGYIKL